MIITFAKGFTALEIGGAMRSSYCWPMASLLRLSLITGLLFFAAVVSDAAMIYQMNLYNASGQSVDLMYKKTVGKWTRLATIPTGRSKTFSYYDGVSLRWKGCDVHYARVDPPPKYISRGLFGASFKAQLAPDLRIYLLPPSASFPSAHLPAQPRGFPLLSRSRKNAKETPPLTDRRIR